MSTDLWQSVEIKTHPIRDGRWVRVIAHIRDNATGEVRKYNTDEILMNDEVRPSDFNWSQNNYSCNCNRALFFGYAIGLTYDETGDRPCGDGAYSVNLENPVTGEVYYREFE